MSLILSAALSVAMSFSQPATAFKAPVDYINEAPAADWVKVDPENVLVMELPSGTMYIGMEPRLAPAHVERIKTLTRQGFYNGTVFHRVIEGFMAQGGDPTGTGQGGSSLPDLEPEFAGYADEMPVDYFGRDDHAPRIGFVGTVPVATQAPTLSKFLKVEHIALWGMHCPGVLSMARASQPNSANSQFFVMLGDKRDGLDQGYTVWGRVLAGYKNAKRINRGEPPARPTPIVRMRVLVDLPPEEMVDIEYLNPKSEAFTNFLHAARLVSDDDYANNSCNTFVPVRINGELTQ